MIQNKNYKKIIEEMIREYQQEPNPSISKLYFILSHHLDEESAEEIKKRVEEVTE